MKRAAIILGIGTLLFAAMSCSNKFLEDNEVDLYSLSDTLFVTSFDQDKQVSLQTPLDKDYDFTIYMLPRWLSFKSMHGKIEDGHFTLDFTVLHEEVPASQAVFYSILYLDVEGLGMISLTLAYTSYSNAEMQYSPTTLTFASASSQQLTVTNTGQGLLVWEVTSKPEWLTMSLTKDTLYPWEYRAIDVGIVKEMLTTGELKTGTIMILSNARFSHFTIPVSVTLPYIPPSDPGQITSILTDAEYHHGTGIMALCTKSPDQILLFNTVTGETDTIPLDKTPACISFTEDGHEALLGYSVASVAHIDIDNSQILAEYDIDCIPYDIVPGENGWCYITPASDQWVMLRNLNLNTGEVITSTTATSIYEDCVIRKVPGKPYLAGSQLGLSPSGLLVFDLTDGQAKDGVTWYHESIGHLWLSKDGTKVYSSYKNVYTLPQYDGQYHHEAPSVFGNIGSDMPYIHALDECPAISTVFLSSTIYYSLAGATSLIEQFSITGLNRTGTFNVSPVWINVNGSDYLYETTPRFIFVNKEGTAMYVIKTLKQEYDSDCWFLETIDL